MLKYCGTGVPHSHQATSVWSQYPNSPTPSSQALSLGPFIFTSPSPIPGQSHSPCPGHNHNQNPLHQEKPQLQPWLLTVGQFTAFKTVLNEAQRG